MTGPTKEQARDRLQRALDALPSLRGLMPDSPEFKRWRRNTEIAITKTFGEGSRHVTDFTNVDYWLSVWSSETLDSDVQRVYVSGLDAAASVLRSMLDEVEEYWQEDDVAEGARAPHAGSTGTGLEVFIVHGRDDGTKEAVARLLAKLGLSPVILHERPNQGRTLIEKFEEHAEVGFAVALLTPDDVGSHRGQELAPRARQNVVFEFGYFVGRLGRTRVCALTTGSIELPSDYEGIVYIPLDEAGAWRMALVRELKAAGFTVDANLAF